MFIPVFRGAPSCAYSELLVAVRAYTSGDATLCESKLMSCWADTRVCASVRVGCMCVTCAR